MYSTAGRMILGNIPLGIRYSQTAQYGLDIDRNAVLVVQLLVSVVKNLLKTAGNFSVSVKTDAMLVGQKPHIRRALVAGKVKPEDLGRLGDVVAVGEAAVHQHELSRCGIGGPVTADGMERAAAHINAQEHIEEIAPDLIAGHALIAPVLDEIIQVLTRKRRRNGKVHTRREQQAFVGWFHRHHLHESIQKL